jgi:hypothetical protein
LAIEDLVIEDLAIEDLAMQKPPPADTDDRVVPLHKTAASGGRLVTNPKPRGSNEAQPQIGDLDPYPQSDEADDYRHRMLTNVAGVAVVVLLIVIGIWIADTMASMRKNQDCVLSGRRGCAPVEAPVQGRW